jgi:hypothetical protein
VEEAGKGTEITPLAWTPSIDIPAGEGKKRTNIFYSVKHNILYHRFM